MTRRSSLRAQAQRIYREVAADEAGAATPTPDPSPQGGGEHAAASGQPTQLTARVRRLYEESAAPVAEIARLAGVTERTIYKYAQKGGWKPRYAWLDRGGAARRRWRAQGGVAPVQGAGGRFVRREDKGKPYARGLKATDRQGASRAAAQCAGAETIAAQAQAEAEWQVWNEAFVAWLKTAAMLRDALAVYRKQRKARRANQGAGETDAYEQTLTRCGHLAVDYLQWCQAQAERCSLRAVLPPANAVRAARAGPATP